MAKQVFINLPVANIDKSFALYKAMGFTVNEQFSDATAKCMVWSDTIFVMLMNHDKMNDFTTKPIADIKTGISAIYALSLSGVDEINSLAQAAYALGATEPTPYKDHGFMQVRTVEDYDGHTWELFFMDLSKMPSQ